MPRLRWAFAPLLLFMAGGAAAQGGQYDVPCYGKIVGTVSYGPKTNPDNHRNGLFATFAVNKAEFATLTEAAHFCDEDHFNWAQLVLDASHLPVDSSGNRLKPPFYDPPPGGYGDNPDTPDPDGLKADQYPWYWNEAPGGSDGFSLNDNISLLEDELYFEDYPVWIDTSQTIQFATYLISVNADHSYHDTHGGWLWQWSSASGGGGTVGAFQALPEPASWIMLLSGFALAGGALRRRRAEAPRLSA